MLTGNYLAALHIIYEQLKNTDINWVITGSVGFVLQGVETAVHDIDLQTDRDGAYDIERIFANYILRPVQFSSTDSIRSHFGAFELNGIKVEIMGDIQKRLDDQSWEAPPDLNKLKCWIERDGMRLPVLSLAYEYQAYLKLGRVEKAALLKKHLGI